MGKSSKKHASKVEAVFNDDLESQKDVSAPVDEENSKTKVERAVSEENDKSGATLKKRKNSESKDCLNLKKPKKHVLSLGRVMSFNDLPLELVGDKILSKVPITSLRAVRSTCKLWNSLSKEWMLGKAPASKRQFMSLMTMDYKVYSLRIHLHIDNLSLPRLTVMRTQGQVEAQWYGTLIWGKQGGPRTNFHKCNRYAFGYDKNRNHKILRYFDDYDIINKKLSFMVEIYDLRSHSWRVLDVTSDWTIEYGAHGASLKRNTYFLAEGEVPPRDDDGTIVVEDFLICFDFTNERFGSLLPLPFHYSFQEAVTLSCVGEEQLAVLYQYQGRYTRRTFEFWMTTKIEPDAVSWSKFLKVDMTPHLCYLSKVVSFFIDEEEKVAVVFNGDEGTVTYGYHSAFIVGDDAYFKCVNLGKCPTVTRPPLLCSSSHLPSLVQIN
ncbi:hypothetical protein DY000_02025021 [Brassica cretica]|uniref:F-box domain-containing protein n=1 Tax=Brassica cretica TaxID=69181 RepID=A0ABQ7EC09_BRACR|nr:hypothetical protein DY000_02025021 [Brassica cretica]